MAMKWFDWLLISLVLVGGINWGLVGLFDFNLVTKIFSDYAKYVYDIVGIAAVISAVRLVINR